MFFIVAKPLMHRYDDGRNFKNKKKVKKYEISFSE
jgi:hypothetical protein